MLAPPTQRIAYSRDELRHGDAIARSMALRQQTPSSQERDLKESQGNAMSRVSSYRERYRAPSVRGRRELPQIVGGDSMVSSHSGLEAFVEHSLTTSLSLPSGERAIAGTVSVVTVGGCTPAACKRARIAVAARTADVGVGVLAQGQEQQEGVVALDDLEFADVRVGDEWRNWVGWTETR
jgi:hypothetical protein